MVKNLNIIVVIHLKQTTVVPFVRLLFPSCDVPFAFACSCRSFERNNCRSLRAIVVPFTGSVIHLKVTTVVPFVTTVVPFVVIVVPFSDSIVHSKETIVVPSTVFPYCCSFLSKVTILFS
jgi:hypothetical protein